MARDAAPMTDPRGRFLSRALIVASLVSTLLLSLALDLTMPTTADGLEVFLTLVINVTAVMFALVGSIVESRRRGHRVGRLMMLTGPLYAFLALGWQDSLRPVLDLETYRVVNWIGIHLSWAGIALFAGWLPLIFPDGLLPSRRWRVPAFGIAALGTTCLLANAVRPGPLAEGIEITNPFGLPDWPPVFRWLADALPVTIVALVVFALVGLWARYRRGDPVERLQIRWLLLAVAVLAAGFAGNIVEGMIRTDDGYFVSAPIFALGLMFMPIAIGMAILRYRLYEIDRIISRTIGWGVTTTLIVAGFVASVVGLQALLGPVTRDSTFAVAASTLLAAAAFQPLRRRIQQTADRRFYRARTDAEATIARFNRQARDEVDLARLRAAVAETADAAVRPTVVGVWVRGRRGAP
jgi:hypothetical protein